MAAEALAAPSASRNWMRTRRSAPATQATWTLDQDRGTLGSVRGTPRYDVSIERRPVPQRRTPVDERRQALVQDAVRVMSRDAVAAATTRASARMPSPSYA